MPGPGHMGRNMHSKDKLDLKAIKKLVIFCKEFIPAIVVAVTCSLLSIIPNVIGPAKIAVLTNIISDGLKLDEGVDMTSFKEIAIFLICLYVVGALISYCQQWIMANTTQSIAKKLRSAITSKLNRLPLKFFDQSTRGDILSRITNDVDTISQTLSMTLASLISAVALFIGVLFMMLKVSLILTAVSFVCSVLGFISMFTLSGKSQKYFNKRQSNLGTLNGHIEEIYTNHHVVKSFNGADEAISTFNSENNELYKNSMKANIISSIMRPIMALSGNLAYGAIFVVGVIMILNKNPNMTYGTIISFTMYSRLFSQPLSTFAQSISSLQSASAASKRIFEVLESEEMQDESNGNEVINNVKGDVSFKDVRFGYKEDHEIIHGFSYDFKAGQKVAIVGPTGAGKTTIVNLLERFYEVNEGSICIDGINIKDMKKKDVRNLFDMILQDTWLFEGTIRENLIYNQKNVTDEKLNEVCRAVGLRHFIKSLKDGYDTKLDDNLALSEGQKQQLTIARAMIKDSPLLILDEATSSVDTRTEISIQKAMDELTKGRTSFIIAHRLSTIKNADIILVLNKGDIVEAGKHEELLKKNGFYADLYNSQFEVNN